MTFTRPTWDCCVAEPYRINRWRVVDRVGLVLHYAAYYRDEPLHREPLGSLDDARRLCAQHADLVAVRESRGWVGEMDKEG